MRRRLPGFTVGMGVVRAAVSISLGLDPRDVFTRGFSAATGDVEYGDTIFQLDARRPGQIAQNELIRCLTL